MSFALPSVANISSARASSIPSLQANIRIPYLWNVVAHCSGRVGLCQFVPATFNLIGISVWLCTPAEVNRGQYVGNQWSYTIYDSAAVTFSLLVVRINKIVTSSSDAMLIVYVTLVLYGLSSPVCPL